MAGQNCWEYKNCERIPGGARAVELGICPVYNYASADGFCGGKNGGRACAFISGSLCNGYVHGTQKDKESDCHECDFYHILEQKHKGQMSAASFNSYIKDKGKKNILGLFREFFRVLFTDSYTYNIFKNRYIIFGLLAGLQVPIAVVLGHYYGFFKAYDKNPLMLIEELFRHWYVLHVDYPLYMAYYDFAVIILGIVFGALGTMRKNRDSEITNVLDHIKLGIITIDSNLVIGDEYSVECHRIFQRGYLSGMKFPDLVYQKNRAVADIITEYLQKVFTPDGYTDEEVDIENPLKFIEYLPDGDEKRKKYLEAWVSRIWKRNKIKKVMICVEDISEKINLEKKLEEVSVDALKALHRTSQIMEISPQRYYQFMEEGNRMIQDIAAKMNDYKKIKNIQSINNAITALASFRSSCISLNLDYMLKILQPLEMGLTQISKTYPILVQEAYDTVINQLRNVRKELKEEIN